jgi:Tfp pilus assembly protein PilP
VLLRWRGEEYVQEEDVAEWLAQVKAEEAKRLEAVKPEPQKPVKTPPKPATIRVELAPEPVRDLVAEAQRNMWERYQESLVQAEAARRAYEKWIDEDDEEIFALLRKVDE